MRTPPPAEAHDDFRTGKRRSSRTEAFRYEEREAPAPELVDLEKHPRGLCRGVREIRFLCDVQRRHDQQCTTVFGRIFPVKKKRLLPSCTRCVFDLLASVPAIGSLDLVFRRNLLWMLEVVSRRKGQVLFRQGDEQETVR